MVYTITVHLRANAEPSSVDKLKAKLIEASRIYSKDKETISWFVMQSTADPRDFTIVCLLPLCPLPLGPPTLKNCPNSFMQVERYEQESVSPLITSKINM